MKALFLFVFFVNSIVYAVGPRVDVPPNAKLYLPELVKVVDDYWAEAKDHKKYLAAQIEQETCISLKSKGCWNPKTELKTDREYGFNLSQITIAYNKNGSVRFDNFKEAKRLHPDLANWPWEDRWNPRKGIMVMVLMMKREHKFVGQGTKDFLDGMKFAWSAYNGGRSHVVKAKAICYSVKGCDNYKWEDNVALYLPKSKKPFHGYKVSPYEINTGYVHNITQVRYKKYERWLNKPS